MIVSSKNVLTRIPRRFPCRGEGQLDRRFRRWPRETERVNAAQVRRIVRADPEWAWLSCPWTFLLPVYGEERPSGGPSATPASGSHTRFGDPQ